MADPKLTIDQDVPQDHTEEVVVLTDEGPAGIAAADTDDDDDGDDDEVKDLRVAHDQIEDITDKRKRERKERKERQRIARERKDEELVQLRTQNQQFAERLARLEGATGQNAISTIEQKLNNARQHKQIAEQQIADAINRGDGDAHVKALRYRDEAAQAVQQLDYQIRVAKAQPQEKREEAQQQKPQIDPTVQNHAANWFKANPWFDYNADTPLVRRAKVAEKELLDEGYTPNDREFWSELTARVKEKAPVSRQNGGPPVAGAADGAGAPGKKVTYRLSQDRIQAMKDAGIWDDPVKKDKQIRAYMAYDKNPPANAR